MADGILDTLTTQPWTVKLCQWYHILIPR